MAIAVPLGGGTSTDTMPITATMRDSTTSTTGRGTEKKNYDTKQDKDTSNGQEARSSPQKDHHQQHVMERVVIALSVDQILLRIKRGVGQSLFSSPTAQFLLVASCILLSHGSHNVLQEAILTIPSFSPHKIMLGYLEVAGVSICSFVERTYLARESGRVAPLSSYPILTLFLLGSTALSSLSLHYINFPTRVVFRSCKLLPTMVIATCLHRKTFSWKEYLLAMSICVGLVLFAAADWKLAPTFHPIGLILVSISTCADAVLPNLQERLFQRGSSRLEVTLYTNATTWLAMTMLAWYSGDLAGVLRQALLDQRLATYLLVDTFVAYLAISLHIYVVKRYGSVTAVLLATGRKAMTLVLSFVLFPNNKTFSWLYPMGATLVFGGLVVTSLIRSSKKGHDAKALTTSETRETEISVDDDESDEESLDKC